MRYVLAFEVLSHRSPLGDVTKWDSQNAPMVRQVGPH